MCVCVQGRKKVYEKGGAFLVENVVCGTWRGAKHRAGGWFGRGVSPLRTQKKNENVKGLGVLWLSYICGFLASSSTNVSVKSDRIQ